MQVTEIFTSCWCRLLRSLPTIHQLFVQISQIFNSFLCSVSSTAVYAGYSDLHQLFMQVAQIFTSCLCRLFRSSPAVYAGYSDLQQLSMQQIFNSCLCRLVSSLTDKDFLQLILALSPNTLGCHPLSIGPRAFAGRGGGGDFYR